MLVTGTLYSVPANSTYSRYIQALRSTYQCRNNGLGLSYIPNSSSSSKTNTNSNQEQKSQSNDSSDSSNTQNSKKEEDHAANAGITGTSISSFFPFSLFSSSDNTLSTTSTTTNPNNQNHSDDSDDPFFIPDQSFDDPLTEQPQSAGIFDFLFGNNQGYYDSPCGPATGLNVLFQDVADFYHPFAEGNLNAITGKLDYNEEYRKRRRDLGQDLDNNQNQIQLQEGIMGSSGYPDDINFNMQEDDNDSTYYRRRTSAASDQGPGSDNIDPSMANYYQYSSSGNNNHRSNPNSSPFNYYNTSVDLTSSKLLYLIILVTVYRLRFILLLMLMIYMYALQFFLSSYAHEIAKIAITSATYSDFWATLLGKITGLGSSFSSSSSASSPSYSSSSSHASSSPSIKDPLASPQFSHSFTPYNNFGSPLTPASLGGDEDIYYLTRMPYDNPEWYLGDPGGLGGGGVLNYPGSVLKDHGGYSWNIFFVCLMLLVQSYSLEVLMRKDFVQVTMVFKESRRSDALLRNILPDKIIARLKDNYSATSASYDDVTILFTHVDNFSEMAHNVCQLNGPGYTSKTGPFILVEFLNRLFFVIDQECKANKCEKIKTVGDAYMAASGLPDPTPLHAKAIARLALRLVYFSIMGGDENEKLRRRLRGWWLDHGYGHGGSSVGSGGRSKFYEVISVGSGGRKNRRRYKYSKRKFLRNTKELQKMTRLTGLNTRFTSGVASDGTDSQGQYQDEEEIRMTSSNNHEFNTRYNNRRGGRRNRHRNRNRSSDSHGDDSDFDNSLNWQQTEISENCSSKSDYDSNQDSQFKDGDSDQDYSSSEFDDDDDVSEEDYTTDSEYDCSDLSSLSDSESDSMDSDDSELSDSDYSSYSDNSRSEQTSLQISSESGSDSISDHSDSKAYNDSGTVQGRKQIQRHGNMKLNPNDVDNVHQYGKSTMIDMNSVQNFPTNRASYDSRASYTNQSDSQQPLHQTYDEHGHLIEFQATGTGATLLNSPSLINKKRDTNTNFNQNFNHFHSGHKRFSQFNNSSDNNNNNIEVEHDNSDSQSDHDHDNDVFNYPASRITESDILQTTHKYDNIHGRISLESNLRISPNLNQKNLQSSSRLQSPHKSNIDLLRISPNNDIKRQLNELNSNSQQKNLQNLHIPQNPIPQLPTRKVQQAIAMPVTNNLVTIPSLPPLPINLDRDMVQESEGTQGSNYSNLTFSGKELPTQPSGLGSLTALSDYDHDVESNHNDIPIKDVQQQVNYEEVNALSQGRVSTPCEIELIDLNNGERALSDHLNVQNQNNDIVDNCNDIEMAGLISINDNNISWTSSNAKISDSAADSYSTASNSADDSIININGTFSAGADDSIINVSHHTVESMPKSKTESQQRRGSYTNRSSFQSILTRPSETNPMMLNQNQHQFVNEIEMTGGHGGGISMQRNDRFQQQQNLIPTTNHGNFNRNLSQRNPNLPDSDQYDNSNFNRAAASDCDCDGKKQKKLQRRLLKKAKRRERRERRRLRRQNQEFNGDQDEECHRSNSHRRRRRHRRKFKNSKKHDKNHNDITNAHNDTTTSTTQTNTNQSTSKLNSRLLLEEMRSQAFRDPVTGKRVGLRCGIHSGQCVAGVIGKTKFTYDVWGDAVNTASRMESNGEVFKVHCTQETRDLVCDDFNCEAREPIINVKGKGQMQTYFISSQKDIRKLFVTARLDELKTKKLADALEMAKNHLSVREINCLIVTFSRDLAQIVENGNRSTHSSILTSENLKTLMRSTEKKSKSKTQSPKKQQQLSVQEFETVSDSNSDDNDAGVLLQDKRNTESDHRFEHLNHNDDVRRGRSSGQGGVSDLNLNGNQEKLNSMQNRRISTEPSVNQNAPMLQTQNQRYSPNMHQQSNNHQNSSQFDSNTTVPMQPATLRTAKSDNINTVTASTPGPTAGLVNKSQSVHSTSNTTRSLQDQNADEIASSFHHDTIRMRTDIQEGSHRLSMTMSTNTMSNQAQNLNQMQNQMNQQQNQNYQMALNEQHHYRNSQIQPDQYQRQYSTNSNDMIHGRTSFKLGRSRSNGESEYNNNLKLNFLNESDNQTQPQSEFRSWCNLDLNRQREFDNAEAPTPPIKILNLESATTRCSSISNQKSQTQNQYLTSLPLNNLQNDRSDDHDPKHHMNHPHDPWQSVLQKSVSQSQTRSHSIDTLQSESQIHKSETQTQVSNLTFYADNIRSQSYQSSSLNSSFDHSNQSQMIDQNNNYHFHQAAEPNKLITISDQQEAVNNDNNNNRTLNSSLDISSTDDHTPFSLNSSHFKQIPVEDTEGLLSRAVSEIENLRNTSESESQQQNG